MIRLAASANAGLMASSDWPCTRLPLEGTRRVSARIAGRDFVFIGFISAASLTYSEILQSGNFHFFLRCSGLTLLTDLATDEHRFTRIRQNPGTEIVVNVFGLTFLRKAILLSPCICVYPCSSVARRLMQRTLVSFQGFTTITWL